MDISDFRISCEELGQLMPVLEKCDPSGPNFFSGRLLSVGTILKRPVVSEKLTIEPRWICSFCWERQ